MKLAAKLALQRIRELNQRALICLHDMEKWREKPLTDQERTVIHVQHNSALNEVSDWLKAIEEVEDD